MLILAPCPRVNPYPHTAQLIATVVAVLPFTDLGGCAVSGPSGSVVPVVIAVVIRGVVVPVIFDGRE
jgi:hypothetical protein